MTLWLLKVKYVVINTEYDAASEGALEKMVVFPIRINENNLFIQIASFAFRVVK